MFFYGFNIFTSSQESIRIIILLYFERLFRYYYLMVFFTETSSLTSQQGYFCH